MAFKRKRSVDEPLGSACSFGNFATPEAQPSMPIASGYAIDMGAPTSRAMGWDFSNWGRVKSGDWIQRTRKRLRDNRPDEGIIHETTLNKLFSAQRKQPHVEPTPSESLSSPQTRALPKLQKSTLHAFWNITSSPIQSVTPQLPHVHDAYAPRCEDCDVFLEADANDMDVDMDVDGAMDGSPFACIDCGRNVCAKCAVVANARHCLQCATSARNPKKWW